MAKVVVNLFTDEEGNARRGSEAHYSLSRKVKKKRVHYSTPTYKKDYGKDAVDGKLDMDTWGRMEELYKRLANFFPIFLQGSLLSHLCKGELVRDDEEQTVFDFGMVRSWKNKYYEEAYTYRGQIFKGQEFEDVGAEIKGTEDLNIQERLFIHEELLDALEEGYEIEQLNQWLEEMVNYFQHGATASSYCIALLLLGEGVKNPPNPSERRIL